MDIDTLQDALGYLFNNPALAREALTHTSWLKEEHDQGRAENQRDQQRLEYLGDAFLGYEVARMLFAHFPNESEAELTRRRISLVKGDYLDAIGERLGIRPLLFLGQGERSKGSENKRVLEDAVEALIGAVLLDGGEEAARDLIGRLFNVQDSVPNTVNPISAFNERWQQMYKEAPPKPDEMEDVNGGPTRWTIVIRFPDRTRFVGRGSNKSTAMREACQKALEHWPHQS